MAESEYEHHQTSTTPPDRRPLPPLSFCAAFYDAAAIAAARQEITTADERALVDWFRRFDHQAAAYAHAQQLRPTATAADWRDLTYWLVAHIPDFLSLASPPRDPTP